MTDVTRERIILLWGTVRESALAKGLASTWEESVCVYVCVCV